MLSDKEKALFFSSPLMDKGNEVEAINVISENFYRIRNLTENEEIEDRSIILLYLCKWCSQKYSDKRGDDMVVLTPEAKKLKESWIKEGREEIISNILSHDLSFEETSKLTGLSVEEISKIANAL